MRYLIAFILYLICNLASADDGTKYRNTIWVYTHDYVYLFQSCWTVTEHPDYLGNYCQGEFYNWGSPSPGPNTSGQYLDLVIFDPVQGPVYFVDESGDCYLLRKDTVHGDGVTGDDTEYNTYYIQCGDYIFNDSFEDRSQLPPGE